MFQSHHFLRKYVGKYFSSIQIFYLINLLLAKHLALSVPFQIGESYHFDIFHTERNPCSSELFLEIQGVEFLPLDPDNPPVDYAVSMGEDLHLNGILESIWVADVFSTGPNYQVTITSGT